MSAPSKPKTKGRKSKIPDTEPAVPSNVQAHPISKPQLPPTAASQSPQTPVIVKSNSMSMPVSASPRHGVGGSLAEEQVSGSYCDVSYAFSSTDVIPATF